MDVPGSRNVKDENGTLLAEQTSVKEAWKQYFSRLLNGESDQQVEVCDPVCGPIEEITREEVEVAISKMKKKKELRNLLE